MRSKKNQSNRERGQSLVEFVMSITFLILLVAGIVDLGRAFFTYIALRDAAQEGAAYASVARIYRDEPMKCAEIAQRARTTSDTQMVDLADTDVDISYFAFIDPNLLTPYNCNALNPDTVPIDKFRSCFRSTVVVTVTFPDFPLVTPFLGSLFGTQTIPIQARIEDTVLTPECN